MRVPISPEGVEAFRTLAATLRDRSEQMSAATDKLLTAVQEKSEGLGVFAEKIEDNVGQVANIVREQSAVVELLSQSCEKLAAQIEEVLTSLDLSEGGTPSASSISTQITKSTTPSTESESGESPKQDVAATKTGSTDETKGRSGLSMRDVAALGLTAGYLATMGLTPPDNSAAEGIREIVQEVFQDVKETIEKGDEVSDKVSDMGEAIRRVGEGMGGDPPERYESIDKALTDLGASLPPDFKWSSK